MDGTWYVRPVLGSRAHSTVSFLVVVAPRKHPTVTGRLCVVLIGTVGGIHTQWLEVKFLDPLKMH